MCAYLERFGFQILCSDRYATAPASLSIRPDALLLRLQDPVAVSESTVTANAACGLRAMFPETPIIAVTDRPLALTESEAFASNRIPVTRRQPGGWERLAQTLEVLLSPPRS